MSRYLRRFTSSLQQEKYLVQVKLTRLILPVSKDIRGIYVKCKRGKVRVSSNNRHCLCPENSDIDINEYFEFNSVFFKNQTTNKYQPKQLSIKVKQDCKGQKKDSVVIKALIDLSQYINVKDRLIHIDLSKQIKGASIEALITIDTEVQLSPEQISMDLNSEVSSNIGGSQKDLDYSFLGEYTNLPNQGCHLISTTDSYKTSRKTTDFTSKEDNDIPDFQTAAFNFALSETINNDYKVLVGEDTGKSRLFSKQTTIDEFSPKQQTVEEQLKQKDEEMKKYEKQCQDESKFKLIQQFKLVDLIVNQIKDIRIELSNTKAKNNKTGKDYQIFEQITEKIKRMSIDS